MSHYENKILSLRYKFVLGGVSLLMSVLFTSIFIWKDSFNNISKNQSLTCGTSPNYYVSSDWKQVSKKRIEMNLPRAIIYFDIDDCVVFENNIPIQ